MEGTEALSTTIGATLEGRARAEELHKARFLYLLFKAMLQSIVRFRCFLHCVDGHGTRL